MVVCYRQVSLAQRLPPTPIGASDGCIPFKGTTPLIPSPKFRMPHPFPIMRKSTPEPFPNAIVVGRLGKTSARLHFHASGVVDMHMEVVLANLDVYPVVGHLVAGFEFGLLTHVVHLPRRRRFAGTAVFPSSVTTFALTYAAKHDKLFRYANCMQILAPRPQERLSCGMTIGGPQTRRR